MVDARNKNGFSAIAAEVPEKPDTFRVLVGPLAENIVDKTRADLDGARFPPEDIPSRNASSQNNRVRGGSADPPSKELRRPDKGH